MFSSVNTYNFHSNVKEIKEISINRVYKQRKGPPLCTKDHNGHFNQHIGPTFVHIKFQVKKKN